MMSAQDQDTTSACESHHHRPIISGEASSLNAHVGREWDD
jgi:hypothetical protein